MQMWNNICLIDGTSHLPVFSAWFTKINHLTTTKWYYFFTCSQPMSIHETFSILSHKRMLCHFFLCRQKRHQKYNKTFRATIPWGIVRAGFPLDPDSISCCLWSSSHSSTSHLQASCQGSVGLKVHISESEFVKH